MPYRSAGTPASTIPTDFSEVVVEVETLIALLRELEKAERAPGRERLRVKELRPEAHRALAEFPLTRDRSRHWQHLVSAGDSDEVIEFLKKQISLPEELSIETRGDMATVFALIPIIGASVYLAIATYFEAGLNALLVVLPFTLASLGYGVLWTVSRAGTERRVRLLAEEVWLPPTSIWLRGRRARYEDIETLPKSGSARSVKFVCPTGTVRYAKSAVNVRKLVEEFEMRRKAAKRRARVQRQFAAAGAVGGPGGVG